jgi:bacterioferritin-associated ferredoxin
VYICICNAITERQVRECASAGATSIDDLSSSLGVGSGCGRCVECAVELLREACAPAQSKTVVAISK